MDWNCVLKWVSASSPFVIAIVGLILFRRQERYKHLISKQLKDYEANIQKELRSFEGSIQKEVNKHSVQFSELHRRRADVIYGVYNLLVEIQTQLMIIFVDSGNKYRSDTDFWDLSKKLAKLYISNSILFENSLTTKIDNILTKFFTALGVKDKIDLYVIRNEGKTFEPDMLKNKDSLDDMIKKEIPNLLLDLKKEFQKLLLVENIK